MTSLIWIFVGTLLADLVTNFNDLLIITDDGCFLAGISVIVFKHLIFQIRRNEIIKLIDDVYNPLDCIAKSSDEGVLVLLKTTVTLQKLQTCSFAALGSFLVVALVALVPTKNGSLPIRAKYPFDSTIEPMHTVAFAIQAGAVAIGIAAIVCMDETVVNFCRYVAFQLEILASNYRHCQTKWPRAPLDSTLRKVNNPEAEIHSFIAFSKEEAREVDDSFVKRFRICIKHHQRLVDIVDDMNFVFGSSCFSQLVASSSMIVFTGFQAALGANSSASLMKFALYCGAAFSQLLSWCLMGNMLLHQGFALADSQWLSGWEDEDFSKNGHLIIVSIIRGKRKFALRAIDFYSMSMETFIMILRASYSFFALLTAVTNDEDDMS